MGSSCGLTWRALVASTISNHAYDVLGDGFFGSSEFSLLCVGYFRVFGGCLVHEVLIDSDGAVFEIISLGEDP